MPPGGFRGRGRGGGRASFGGFDFSALGTTYQEVMNQPREPEPDFPVSLFSLERGAELPINLSSANLKAGYGKHANARRGSTARKNIIRLSKCSDRAPA